MEPQRLQQNSFNGLAHFLPCPYIYKMKLISLFTLIVCVACNGSLSDEQREKFKKAREENKIVKVSDAEIVSEAMDEGKAVYTAIEASAFDSSKIPSLEKKYNVKIRKLIPGASNALQMEQELIDAYVTGMAEGVAEENMQKVWIDQQKTDYDSLLYSKPSIKKLADGTEMLDGIWNIYLSKKQVVLNIGKTRKY
jgi:hypothetical protein